MSNDAQEAASVPSTYERLAARFDPGEHKTKTIGGTGLTYVDGETIISRLNAVLGYDGWSFEVGQINVLEREVWATGKLTVYVGDRVIVREQVGGQIINRTRVIPARAAVPADGDRPAQPAVPASGGEIIELSNDIKGAITDCLKKCATLVGVGLYLYDPEARREVADEMRAEKRGGTRHLPAADPTPLKTKVELVRDLQTGMEYARTLGLNPAEVDAGKLNRAELEDVIEALRAQCRAAKAAKQAS